MLTGETSTAATGYLGIKTNIFLSIADLAGHKPPLAPLQTDGLDFATPLDLSAQVVINCQAGGSCNGGDPILVY